MDSINLPKSPDRKEAVARGWQSIASTVAILVLAPVLAVFITIFVFQSYEVYGASMENNLASGDRLIVQKLSRNWHKLRGDEYIPQRYEIIIFDKPRFISTGDNVRHLIKRVIGLPGDRVVVKDGVITVYNAEHPDGYDVDEGQEYAANLAARTTGEADFTVEDGEVFVVGDNRSNSLDSRSFGPISIDSITGSALFRFLPLSGAQRL